MGRAIKVLLPLCCLLVFCHDSFCQDTLTYRGCDYISTNYDDSKNFYIISTGQNLYSKYDLIIRINTLVFRNTTEIRDEQLEKMYILADKNKSASLSWSEIEAFQNMLVAKYKYFICDTIVTPDRFIKYGGGKCDDWSLMTAGLLRFWDWEPYIARFGKTKVIGHAVCLVYVQGTVPANYMYYEIQGREGIPQGKYVPIDYGIVGGLSAIDGRWGISHIYIPESLYHENAESDTGEENEGE